MIPCVSGRLAHVEPGGSLSVSPSFPANPFQCAGVCSGLRYVFTILLIKITS